jgi:hypothetical protein
MGANPNYRNSACDLFTGVPAGPDELVVDFAGVVFISRGFADQFHKERMAFHERNGAHVVIENANDDVHLMLQAVSVTQEVVSRSPLSIPIIRVKNAKELEELMLQP